jgi:hypothetical protein
MSVTLELVVGGVVAALLSCQSLASQQSVLLLHACLAYPMCYCVMVYMLASFLVRPLLLLQAFLAASAAGYLAVFHCYASFLCMSRRSTQPAVWHHCLTPFDWFAYFIEDSSTAAA